MADIHDEKDLAVHLQAALGDAFTIERELTAGAMSRVFVAFDRRLERRVAVKVLPRRLAAEVSVDRFRREIMLSASLQHPNIVPVLSAAELEGLPYYLMPYIEGESLRARISRGPLSIRETVSIMKDVARALGYAHAQGVIHRDIKPDNILLSAGAATVADFGVAKAIAASRRQGTGYGSAGAITGVGISLGTPAYMAPEQVSADPATDHRADLYALGIVAYEMLAGAPPFRARTPQQILAAHLTETPQNILDRRYDVPDPLADVIMACLRKDAHERPKSANEIVRALDDPGVSSGAFDPLKARRRRTAAGKQRTAFSPSALAGGALGAIALVIAGGFWWSGREDAAASAAADSTASASLLGPPPIAGSALAVLPLQNIGTDRADSVFAQGITAQLTDALGQVPGVRVASLTAARAASARLSMPAEAALLLNVRLLVEGTVQRQAERVRVSVRLLEASSDSTIWSQVYERTGTDALTMQGELVEQIVGALQPILSTAPLPAASTPAALPPADSVAAPVTPPVPPADSTPG